MCMKSSSALHCFLFFDRHHLFFCSIQFLLYGVNRLVEKTFKIIKNACFLHPSFINFSLYQNGIFPLIFARTSMCTRARTLPEKDDVPTCMVCILVLSQVIYSVSFNEEHF